MRDAASLPSPHSMRWSAGICSNLRLRLLNGVLAGGPTCGVLQQGLIGNVVVGGAVVAESDSDDAGFRMLDNKDHRKIFVFGWRMGSGEDFDRGALCVEFNPSSWESSPDFTGDHGG